MTRGRERARRASPASTGHAGFRAAGATDPAAPSLIVRVVAVAMLVLGLAAPGAVGAEGEGAVAGRVVFLNATGGAAPRVDEVVLHLFRGGEHLEDRLGRAAEDGEFRFDGLTVGDDYRYEVTVGYQRLSFSSEQVRLTPDAPERRVEVVVRDSAPADPGLRGMRLQMVLKPADPDQQVIDLSELTTLRNPSDAVFTPDPRGPAGPMGVVRFGLPAGARDLSVRQGLDRLEILQTDRGFASLAPVPPGDRDFGFSYRLPYEGESVVLDKSLPYGAAQFWVLAPESGPLITAPELIPAETIEVDGTRYRAWIAQNLAAGSRLALQLTGLPVRPFWRTGLDTITRPVVALPLLAALAAGGLAFWLWRRRGHAVGHADPAAETLVNRIADLDDSFGAGNVAEADYRERRAAIKAELRAYLTAGGDRAGFGAESADA